MTTTCDHRDTRADWSMPRGYVLLWRRCSRCGASLDAHFDDQHDDPPAVRVARADAQRSVRA